MKIITLYLLNILAFLILINHSKRFDELTQHVNALENYTKAAIYKKDAQLYIMNTAYGDKDMHKALADSCKLDCITYKNSVNYEYSKKSK